MDRLLDSILCARYADFYRYRHRKNIFKWSYCGNGTFTIIDVMSSLIVNHSSNAFATKLIRQHGGVVLQCNIQDDYINGVSMAGETLSNYVCEICGAPGTEDKSCSYGVEIIRCKNHITNNSEIIDYDFVVFDCLEKKPAWSKFISLLSTILLWEVNNERHRKFHVAINENGEVEINLATRTDFTSGLADVFVCYCNRIDPNTGKVLCNKPPFSNIKPV